jgi:solute carrier family 25 carnitine/acylcarnitine transporter 20/29
LSVYEFLKKRFAGEKGKDTLTPGAILLAGGFAGIANWSVCIPADVRLIKTHISINSEF